MKTQAGKRGLTRTVTVLGGCAIAFAAASCSDDSESRDDVAASSQPSAGTENLSLLGTWTGHRERIASTEGYRNGTATLVVTDQTGQTFKAAMAWSTPEGEVREDLVGAFTPEGSLIAGADAEGSYSFSLVNPETLDYCYSEHGEGYRTTCARLEKQP